MKVADFIQELQDLDAYDATIYVIHEGNLTECRPCKSAFQDIYGNEVPYVFVQAVFQNISTPAENIAPSGG